MALSEYAQLYAIPEWDFTTLDLSTDPVGQIPPITTIPSKTTTKVEKPDTLESIGSFVNKLGGIFESGMDIYNTVRGRTVADKEIAKETVPEEKPPVIIQQLDRKGFYNIYEENKTAVYLIGAGVLILLVSAVYKKVF